jgi:hypothetical protein
VSKLRAEALAEFLASWETEHGALTAEEIARAELELGLAAGDSAQDGRDAGVLQAAAGTADPIDATVVLLAVPGDRILTGDPGDLSRLAEAAGNRPVIVAC